MDTTELFNPKTGRITKLCSLKYTPRTAVAVVENEARRLFSWNIRNEAVDCIIIDGNPISYIFIIVLRFTANFFIAKRTS